MRWNRDLHRELSGIERGIQNSEICRAECHPVFAYDGVNELTKALTNGVPEWAAASATRSFLESSVFRNKRARAVSWR